MEAYKNDYKKNEDAVLWELHEIRHKLHEELKSKSLQKINSDALAKYNSWKRVEKKHAAGSSGL